MGKLEVAALLWAGFIFHDTHCAETNDDRESYLEPPDVGRARGLFDKAVTSKLYFALPRSTESICQLNFLTVYCIDKYYSTNNTK